ncbi:hypothetical protein TCAL_07897 [Tigriopus californicus]|uniref:Uncharacterized protein n=1 Tax=Tigriopus californicus TaxID=6832 RepID=A0A553P6D8_TIGCA|nr:hypothetical protein TCAL_07897 [Tigriopus californicus]|eukprot:TCALIF_07897-PA protein Name:"Protein of unknown function" AED:0.10 eAED:0.23 QI:0/0/0/1/1/1/2/0/155
MNRNSTDMDEKLGVIIEEARLYLAALELCKDAKLEWNLAVTFYKRNLLMRGMNTVSINTPPKDIHSFLTNTTMDVEKTISESKAECDQKAQAFQTANAEVQQLERKLRCHIQKFDTYFEQKDQSNKTLVDQKSLPTESVGDKRTHRSTTPTPNDP